MSFGFFRPLHEIRAKLPNFRHRYFPNPRYREWCVEFSKKPVFCTGEVFLKLAELLYPKVQSTEVFETTGQNLSEPRRKEEKTSCLNLPVTGDGIIIDAGPFDPEVKFLVNGKQPGFPYLVQIKGDKGIGVHPDSLLNPTIA